MSRGQFGPASQFVAIKMAGLLVDRVEFEGEMVFVVFGLRFLPPAAASTLPHRSGRRPM